MKALPAKGIARLMSGVALAGCELNSLRAISAETAFIFAAAATVLMAYIRSDGPIKRDEI
jgi:hypothetical protein